MIKPSIYRSCQKFFLIAGCLNPPKSQQCPVRKLHVIRVMRWRLSSAGTLTFPPGRISAIPAGNLAYLPHRQLTSSSPTDVCASYRDCQKFFLIAGCLNPPKSQQCPVRKLHVRASKYPGKNSPEDDFLLDNLACEQVRYSYYPNKLRILRNASHSPGPCSKEPKTFFPGTMATG